MNRLYKVGFGKLNEELNLDTLNKFYSNEKVLMICKEKYQDWKRGGEPDITKSRIKSQ